jgi:serine protease Do
VSRISPELQRKFYLFVDEGCVITSVSAGSAAENAGLRAGDVIQQINRNAIYDETDFEKALLAVKDDERLVLRVVRGQTVNLLLVRLK